MQAIIGGVVLGLVTVLTGVLDPSRPGTYPPCPFRAVTGLACPGCGSLRALHDLAHGHFLAALGHNAVFVTVLGVVTVLAGRALAGRPAVRPRLWAAPAAAALLLVWTVARNVPAAPFHALAP
jgi:hypothetical protein